MQAIVIHSMQSAFISCLITAWTCCMHWSLPEQKKGGKGFPRETTRQRWKRSLELFILLPPGFLTSRSHTIVNLCSTPSFPIYRAYLKILVFPFYKAQFGCSPSHVQTPRCIKSLHASIKRKLTNACMHCN